MVSINITPTGHSSQCFEQIEFKTSVNEPVPFHQNSLLQI